jgi:hypothetical protein
MKSHFSRVVALSLLVPVSVPSWAQPPEVVVPETRPSLNNFNKSSLDAVAAVGALYTKMNRAKTYSGNMVIRKTIFKEGKEVSVKKTEIRSAWIRNEKSEGAFIKARFDIVYAEKLTDDTVINSASNKVKVVESELKNFRFYETNNVWSERDQKTVDKSLPSGVIASALNSILPLVLKDRLENTTVDGQTRLVRKSLYDINYVLDANTGDLQSLIVSNADRRTEYLWSETQFDVPLPDSIFQWKVPEGAKQVIPGSVAVKVEF